MAHSYGVRARTRHVFSKRFGQHGMPGMSTYMQVYRIGDYVDIKANGAVHKGMPYKYYHGKTGVIFNVTKTAVGVIVHKRVGNRYLEKRVTVRVEHVKPSRCREDFLARVKANNEARREAKEAGAVKLSFKRSPALPRPGHVVETEGNEAITVVPVPYEALI